MLTTFDKCTLKEWAKPTGCVWWQEMGEGAMAGPDFTGGVARAARV